VFAVTPLVASSTTPFETTKSSSTNAATPLLSFDAYSVASSAEIVIVLLVTTVLIPSPAANVIVSPRLIFSCGVYCSETII